MIDLNFRIDTEFFKLSLVSGQRERFLSRSELGEMQIICPPGADFADAELQAWLRKVIEEALRRNAKIILPPRLYMLSQKYNLPYQSVKSIPAVDAGGVVRHSVQSTCLTIWFVAETSDRLCAAARIVSYS